MVPHEYPDELTTTETALTLYSRSLQAYTLRLWTESLKAAEERREHAYQHHTCCTGDLSLRRTRGRQRRTRSATTRLTLT
ncbi:hypothetical protein R3P38DRAFT_2924941 [Favolaschia claudopus]|uniref:Uncharacterized protein n=1 Tax=Favolaschia claudopus TaxID=2862362 RepID=A0AAW0BXQ7_9AGAR